MNEGIYLHPVSTALSYAIEPPATCCPCYHFRLPFLPMDEEEAYLEESTFGVGSGEPGCTSMATFLFGPANNLC